MLTQVFFGGFFGTAAAKWQVRRAQFKRDGHVNVVKIRVRVLKRSTMKGKRRQKSPKAEKLNLGLAPELGCTKQPHSGSGDFAEVIAYFLTARSNAIFDCASKVTSFQPKDVLPSHTPVGNFPLRRSYTLKCHLICTPSSLRGDSPLTFPL